MAQRGKPLSMTEIQRIKRSAEVKSIRATARDEGVSRNTARKYTRPPRRDS